MSSVSSLPMAPITIQPTLNLDPKLVEIQTLQYLNGPAANKASQLLGLLEGVGFVSVRSIIDAYLIDSGWTNATEEGRKDAIKALQNCHGLKEKVALVTALNVARNNEIIPGSDVYAQIYTKANEIINKIEHEYLTRTDFSEDRIMQNALLKNLPVSLKLDQAKKLEEVTRKTKTLLNTEILKTSLDFTHETTAQRIFKIEEMLHKLSRTGEQMEEVSVLMGEIEELKNVKGIENVKNMQQASDALHDSLYTIHEVARHGFKNFWSQKETAALLPAETDKLFVALKSMYQGGFEAFKKSIIEGSNGSLGYLQSLLQALKSSDSAKYQKALKDARLTDAEFEKFFLVYFVRERLDIAKLAFDEKKRETLGANERAFEQDVNKWRGMMRERLVDCQDRIVVLEKMKEPSDIEKEELRFQHELRNSYFEKFPSLFYGEDGDTKHGKTIRAALSGILEDRVPDTAAGAREHATKAIAEYNQLQNQFYHNDRNPLQQEEGGFQRVLKTVGRIETGREAVKKAISGPLNAFGRFAESATKTALKWGSDFAKWATGFVGTQLNKVNTYTEKDVEGKSMISRGLKRLAKTPLYLLWPATKLTEKASTGTSNLIGKAQGVVAKGYDDLLQVVRDTAGDKEINHLYQALTYGIDGVTALTGKAIAGMSNWGYDHLNTAQKREMLAAFYSAAGSEEELRRAVESADLAKSLDFRWNGPNFIPNPDVQDMDFDNSKDVPNVTQSTSSVVAEILAPVQTRWAFNKVDKMLTSWSPFEVKDVSINSILSKKSRLPKINDVFVLWSNNPKEYLRIKVVDIDKKSWEITADIQVASVTSSKQLTKEDIKVKMDQNNKVTFPKYSRLTEYSFTTMQLFEYVSDDYKEVTPKN